MVTDYILTSFFCFIRIAMIFSLKKNDTQKSTCGFGRTVSHGVFVYKLAWGYTQRSLVLQNQMN